MNGSVQDTLYPENQKSQLTKRRSGANRETRLTRIERKQGSKFFQLRHRLIEYRKRLREFSALKPVWI